MVRAKWSRIVAAKTTLNCVNSGNLKFIEQGHASSRLLAPLISKPGVIIDEEWTELTHNEWEKPSFLRLPMHVTAIHKNVFSPAMAVEVAKYLQVSLSFEGMA